MEHHALRLYLVRPISSSDRILEFHSVMFHGRGEPYDATIPEERLEPPHFTPSKPLRIARNAWRVPDVLKPAKNLVVAEHVKTKLEGLPNIGFRKAIFDRLFWFPYPTGDFSFYDRPEYLNDYENEGPYEVAARLPDDPALHKSIGQYYEVTTAHIETIMEHEEVEFFLEFDLKPFGYNETCQLPANWDLVNRYSILRTAHGIMMTQAAFDRLAPHVDWDYFRKSVTEV